MSVKRRQYELMCVTAPKSERRHARYVVQARYVHVQYVHARVVRGALVQLGAVEHVRLVVLLREPLRHNVRPKLGVAGD